MKQLNNTTQSKENKIKKYIVTTMITIIPSTFVLGIITSNILSLSGNKFILNIVFYLFSGILIGCTSIIKNIKKHIKPSILINQFGHSLEQNDLTYRIDNVENLSETETLINLNNTMEKLRLLIQEIKELSTSVHDISEDNKTLLDNALEVTTQVTSSVTDLARTSTKQIDVIEECNNLIYSTSEGLKNILSDMTSSKQLTEKAITTINYGEKSIEVQKNKMHETKNASSSAVESINTLESKSIEIGQIVDVIASISEQTNLLALNASIEAARAGEHGRGFTVVAEEIRNLAEQSNLSAKQIGELALHVQSGVNETVQQITKVEEVISEQNSSLVETINAFKEISQVVHMITSNLNNVADSSLILSNNCNKTVDEMNGFLSISQTYAASSEDVSVSMGEQSKTIKIVRESADNLLNSVKKLEVSIEKYKL
ncbi:methyl-accepting chemotaxis protein [Oceanirhabdus seepicola]|nr:methyl-accepting chemotaxis protein [Oceanirhabdus seepicola]